MAEKALVKKKRPISKVWIVPILAILIGIWMVYKYLDERGREIYITMPVAEGINPGKTQIKVRSVPIGTVTGVRLSDDGQGVIAQADIEKPYVGLLTDDARIWVVQPRIDETGIHGFNTLLSGVYFEFQTGKSEVLSDHFRLLPAPPLVSLNEKGTRYTLYSKNAEVLNIGAPVYFKGYKVGMIEKAEFDWQSQSMNYQIFIEEPNNNLITDNTLFWLESGVELNLSAEGVRFKIGSLTTVLSGGITFGVPEGEALGEVVDEGSHFVLSGSYESSLKERYTDVQFYIINVETTIRGLKPGAPVEYRGVRIGTVVEAPATFTRDQIPQASSEGRMSVPVLIKIEFGRMGKNISQIRDFWLNNFERKIQQQGLRASLQTGNLLTGALFVNLDHYDVPVTDVKTLAGYKVIPTATAGFDQIPMQASDLLKKLNGLNIERTLTKVDETLAAFSGLAATAESLIGQQETRQVPVELAESLKELKKTLRGFQDGSPVYSDLHQAIRSIEQLVKELQPLVRSLNEKPNILIFDKAVEDDIQPRRRGSDD